MFKKMMLLAMAVGVLVAFAAPAVAQASIQLEDESGVLSTNAEVTATSTNLVTTLEGGPVLACEKVTLHFTVVSNTANDVVLQQTNAATTTNCALFAPTAFAATITDGTLGVEENHEITINGAGEGTTNAHFGADVPSTGLECQLDGSVDVLATDGTDVLHVEPSVLTGTGGANCHNGTIEGSFTLETENGAPVTS